MTAPARLAAAAFAAGVAAGAGGARAWSSPSARFARMSGSSVAAPDAAAWVTDFLNAAYYRRPPAERDIDDLRLAFAILTTRWHGLGRERLRLADALPVHAAFGRDRFARAPRGTLDRAQLLDGAARLLGDWFPGAYADADRRGWGIVFETAAERAAHDPERRLRLARLGALTPPAGPAAYHTYPPVALPAPAAALAGLADPATWPDYASALGRFTALRRGGLAGQTFEIEVVAGAATPLPVLQRGYVTATRVLSSDHGGDALRAHVEALGEGLARAGEEAALSPGARPLLAVDLTTHDGHFLGAARSHLLAWEDADGGWIRDVGEWDPLPWHLAGAYALGGREAQHAFWGQGGVAELSMLHQLALRTSR